MLNIAPYLTPLSHSPNPNAGVGNALHGRGLEYNNANEKARLAEQANEFGQRQALNERQQDFNESTSARDFEQHRTELHTKLVEWGTRVLDKEGREKGMAIVGPVWGAAGIEVGNPQQQAPSAASVAQMTAPGMPGPPQEEDEMADLEAAQRERGDLSEYAPEAKPSEPRYGPKPGEGFSAYVARNTANPPKQVAPEKSSTAEATEGPAAAAEDVARAEDKGATALVIVDKKTGRVIGTLDPEKIDRANKDQATARADAYAAGTPEGHRPIVQGFTGAARNEADVEAGMGHAERAISEQEKTSRVEKNHKGGGVGIPALDLGGAKDSKLLNQTNSQVRQYVTTAVNNSGVKQLNQKAQNASQIADMVDSASSGAQRQAFATQLHANFGAASSEGERAFMLEQGGKVSALLAKVDAWVNSGQLPPGLKEEIKAVAQMQAEFAQRYAQAVRDKATKDAMDAPNLGGQYDAAFGRKLSDDEKRKIGASVGNLGGVDGSEGGGSGGEHPNDEFDKLGI